MLLLLRLGLSALFIVLMREAVGSAGNDDLSDAGRFALAVVAGLAASMAWAPILGAAVAGPVTGALVDGSPSSAGSGWLRLARRCEGRRWRRAALFCAFCEGVRRPWLPGAFVVGMDNARPGSRLQRVFAREVWRFSNAGHCLRAHSILTRGPGRAPERHPSPQVNLALAARLREPGPVPAPIVLPPSPPPSPLVRNRRIQLFSGAE